MYICIISARCEHWSLKNLIGRPVDITPFFLREFKMLARTTKCTANVKLYLFIF